VPSTPIKRKNYKNKYEKDRSHPFIDREREKRIAEKEAKYADLYLS
jgi:hypothetical protein